MLMANLSNSELTGDPLDIRMFEATNWSLEEEGKDDQTKFEMLMPAVVKPPKTSTLVQLDDHPDQMPYEVGIIRQFTFRYDSLTKKWRSRSRSSRNL